MPRESVAPRRVVFVLRFTLACERMDQLGTATAAELIEQGQQIERIHAEVQGIDQDLNRADKVCRRLVFVLLVLLLLLLLLLCWMLKLIRSIPCPRAHSSSHSS